MKRVNVRTTERIFELTYGYPTGWFYKGESIELEGFFDSGDSLLMQAMGLKAPEKIIVEAAPGHVTVTGTWEGTNYSILFDSWWYIMAPSEKEALKNALREHCEFIEVPEEMISNVALMRDLVINFWVR